MRRGGREGCGEKKKRESERETETERDFCTASTQANGSLISASKAHGPRRMISR